MSENGKFLFLGSFLHKPASHHKESVRIMFWFSKAFRKTFINHVYISLKAEQNISPTIITGMQNIVCRNNCIDMVLSMDFNKKSFIVDSQRQGGFGI